MENNDKCISIDAKEKRATGKGLENTNKDNKTVETRAITWSA